MFRSFILAAALTLLVGLLTGVPIPAAHAEAGSITVNPIGTKTAPYHGKYRVSPSYTKRGDAVVDSATITVTKGNKTVARDATSVSLAAGTYTVTQKVRYRPFDYQTRQEEVVAVGTWFADYATTPYAATCNLTSRTSTTDTTGTWTGTCDVPQAHIPGTVKVAGTWQLEDVYLHLYNSVGEDVYAGVHDGDAGFEFNPYGRLQALTSLTKPVTEKVYGPSVTITQAQSLTVKAGRKDCATKADYKKVKASLRLGRGDSVKKVAKRLFSKGSRYAFERINGHTIEVRVYDMCSTAKVVAVGFADGRAVKKATGYN